MKYDFSSTGNVVTTGARCTICNDPHFPVILASRCQEFYKNGAGNEKHLTRGTLREKNSHKVGHK